MPIKTFEISNVSGVSLGGRTSAYETVFNFPGISVHVKWIGKINHLYEQIHRTPGRKRTFRLFKDKLNVGCPLNVTSKCNILMATPAEKELESVGEFFLTIRISDKSLF